MTVDERNRGVEKYLPLIHRYARMVERRSPVEYDDAYQELAIVLCKALDRTKDARDKTGLAITAVRFRAKQIMRDSFTMKRTSERAAYDVHDPMHDIEDESFRFSDVHMLDKVRAAVSSRPDREQVIFRRHYMEDWQMGEIAKSLGVTPPAMTDPHNRLKKAMREAILA